MTDSQRADFEAWMRKEHPDYPLEFSHGVYYHSPQQRMFEAYQAGRAALQSRLRTEPSEWLKQHEALMHRVSKAAMVVGYGGTINGAAAETALENVEKALLDHARALQSQDRVDAERYRWLRRSDTGPAKLDSLHNWVNDDFHPPYRELKHGKDLDAAIDYARRIEGES